MPATQPSELVSAVINALQDCGMSGVLVSGIRQHPRKFAVTEPDGTETLAWIYIWTLTTGGRPALEHEFRIQMTTVTSPLALNPFGPTLLLGYEPNRKMFAGFDLGVHRTFTSGSPSVQIDIRVIDEALQDGLAFDRKGNNEIAVAVRPDQFGTYLHNASELHRYGKEAATLGLLKRATARDEITEEEITNLTGERKRIVSVVSRLSRLANFRQQVLNAYGNRCAVSKVQLRLVEAAHILPVGAPGSSDDVRNGIALAPTYHRAYDNGLIYLDESFVMRINPDKASVLTTFGLDAGLPAFTASLGKIYLPQDKKQWPNLSVIRKANRFRQIG
jgi:putative restriction endonuclease